jgi:hypothetical protein
LTAARNLLQVYSTDTGATLTDTVLGELADDAMEEVVLDLVPIMPGQLLSTEDIDLVADTANYTLTNTTWLQIYKVELNTSGKTPHEIDIIDPLDKAFIHTVDETSATPEQCYVMGNVIYFVPTPSTATTGYARVYLVNGEATTIAVAGPTYLPRVAHRLIAYKAAWLAAIAYEVETAPFKELYGKRLEAVRRAWAGRFQQKPRFVRESVAERTTMDSREAAFTDLRWPD